LTILFTTLREEIPAVIQNIWRYIIGTVRFFLLDFGLSQMLRFVLTKPVEKLEVRLPNIPHPLTIRPAKVDLLVLWQTFGVKQGVIPDLKHPQFIIDAGANIGATAVFLANQYPSAQIIAVEPETTNVQLARQNCAHYPNIEIIEGGVWHRSAMLEIENPEDESWAFRIRESAVGDPTSKGVRGFTIDELSQGKRIDLLKVDIEGSEKYIFSEGTSWLSSVNAMLVEIHGKECKRVVTKSVSSAGFRELPQQGEYVVYVR
jgi:FkbM family methyltransferase